MRDGEGGVRARHGPRLGLGTHETGRTSRPATALAKELIDPRGYAGGTAIVARHAALLLLEL